MTNDTTAQEIGPRITACSEQQLEQVARYLLLELDPAPVVLSADVERRIEADKALLWEIAETTGVEAGRSRDIRAALTQIVNQLPELHPAMSAALASIDHDAVTLDVATAIDFSTVVIALAGAILRPRYTQSREKLDPDGKSTAKSETTIEIRGVENVGELLKSLLPFL